MGRREEEWTDRLAAGGQVELGVGGQVLASAGAAGLRLPTMDLLVPWVHLGWTLGESRPAGIARHRARLLVVVSRTWWSEHLADRVGRAVPSVLGSGWNAEVEVEANGRRAPVEEFADWLTDEAVTRAPLPARLCLTPSPQHPVSDRDTNRPVPLERLPASHTLRTDVAAWGAGAAEVEDPAAAGVWDRFWPPGRDLAARLQQETGLPTAVWPDCPEVP